MTAKAKHKRYLPPKTFRSVSRANAYVKELRRALDREEMNGMAIMASRDIIKHRLGVNASVIGAGSHKMESPFFDDLVSGVVDTVIKQRQTIRHLKQLAAPSQQQMMASAVNQQQVAQYAMMNQQAMSALSNATGPTSGTWVSTGSGATTNTYLTFSSNNAIPTRTNIGQSIPMGMPVVPDHSGHLNIADGAVTTIKLPDGTVIEVQKDGSYTIEDTDAKVVYRANRMRDFNRYLNTSDLIGDFVKFCGEHSVRQGEMLELPLKLFIGWLVIRAAEADGEQPPELPLLPDLRIPRCLTCRRFISPRLRAQRIEYCRPICIEKALAA